MFLRYNLFKSKNITLLSTKIINPELTTKNYLAHQLRKDKLEVKNMFITNLKYPGEISMEIKDVIKPQANRPELHPDSLGAHFGRALERAEKSRYTYSMY